MTQYDETFKVPVAYPPREIKKFSARSPANAGIQQLRIAETEKYAHVTYFFNGGEEKKFPGEERILIPSPKDVATYDLKPEMSARKVTEALVKNLREEGYRFGHCQFCQCRHGGTHRQFRGFGESLRSHRRVPRSKSWMRRLSKKGRVIITADHGNIEQLIDYDTGMPHTAHTINRVPVILVDEERKKSRLNEGTAIDVAPQFCSCSNCLNPEMTGHSLIIDP